MLTIQPNIVNHKNIRFGTYSEDEKRVKNEQQYYQRAKDDMDEVINNDNIPEKMKKPFKIFRAGAGAIIDGLAMFWATIMASKFIKGSYNKVASSSFTKKTGEILKPAKAGIKEAGTKLNETLKGQFVKFKKTKVGEKLVGWYDKFAKTSFGEKVINLVKTIKDGTINIKNKIFNSFNKENYDKTTKTAAGVMATGAGATGAYVEINKINNEDKKPQDEYEDSDEEIEQDNDYDRDYDYDEEDE